MRVALISYTRFSTLVQSKGQSLRRQEEKAEKWAAKHGMELDDSLRLRDLGVSAWSGANVETGALAQLLAMVRSDKIAPGSILLIEAMDRLTRQGLDEAIPLFIELLKSGIEIVTLQDEQRYSKASLKDLAKFITAIILLSGANQESEIKSERVRDAYESNRKRGSRQIFGSAPGWLTRKDKFSPWELDPVKAPVVRKVFELMADGWGSGELAKRANAEGWPVPTRLANKKNGGVWSGTMASKMVRSRSAIGEHEHRNRTREANKKHWEGESRGLVIPNYYPAVVDEELFYRVQAAVDRRRKPMGRDQWYFNIWSGLICCGKCGSGVWRKIDFGTTTMGQLRCRAAGAGACTEPSIAIKQVDPTLLMDISAFASMQLGDADVYLAKLDAATSAFNKLEAEGENLALAVAGAGPLPQFLRLAEKLAIEQASKSSEIEQLRKLIAEHTGNLFDTSFADNLLPYLYVKSEEAKEQRARANLMLRRIINKVELIASESKVLVSFRDTRQQIVVAVPKPVKHNLKTEDEPSTPLTDEEMMSGQVWLNTKEE